MISQNSYKTEVFMYNGLLNIYKEKDFTSHDVVKASRNSATEKDRSCRDA